MTVPDNTAVLGIPVKIEDIEKELHQLWEADDASTNASLINLAICSEEKNSLGRNSEMISEITREHACRAIIIGLDMDEPHASVQAWITAHCNLSHGRKSVCCEQIAFHLTGRSRGRFRNTLFAHLQSDLPLVLWWQGELSEVFDEALFRRLDRLVIDSSEWKNSRFSFDKLQAAWDAMDSLVVQDIAWTRTYHFRLAIAGLFDDLIVQESLEAIQRLEVVTQCVYRSSALLMVAWFTELAGWKRAQDLITEDGVTGSYRFIKPNGDIVDVEVIGDDEQAPVSKFELSSDNLTVSVTREQGSQHLHHLIQCDHHVVDIHGPCDGDKCEELVADQLSRGGKNSLYRRVFPKFMDLI